MSLMSLLNQDYSTASSASAQVAQTMQLLAKAKDKAGSSSGGSSQPSVSITVEAKRAAAAKADASKTPAMLADEVRKSFDAQYEKTGRNSANLTEVSGRALAIVALDGGDRFSRAEVAAAKLELRSRDRVSALAMLSSGPLTSATLTTYTTNLLAARDMMSAEEQSLRTANPNLR